MLPAGVHKTSADDLGIDAAFVYAREKWNVPVLVLPASKVGRSLNPRHFQTPPITSEHTGAPAC